MHLRLKRGIGKSQPRLLDVDAVDRTAGEHFATALLPNSVAQPGINEDGEGPGLNLCLIFSDVARRNGTGRDGSNRITKPLLYR